ncbi:trypsin-like peptidase domain-containing protein [Streptomyces sp. ISL-10]|uniref:serine protease n=1 Tax=Streptomyces sp. ISL-10 TaxID=2819172 RepID=UPI001BE77A68|nr:serine protease [Streptomyces sp. ISL-10]MBT2365403.1 trypsin-like peptidase domain-containing protein [Streptomyces sp. ISL-10]
MPDETFSGLVTVARHGEEQHRGCGIYTVNNHVFTANHVIEKVLGRRVVSSDRGTAQADIRFPWAADPKSPVVATLLRNEERDDVATLRLSGPAPEGIQPCLIVPDADRRALVGKTARIQAWIESSEETWIETTISGPHGPSRYQLDTTSIQGYTVKPGFSGAPVWIKRNENEWFVVGMMVRASRKARSVSEMLSSARLATRYAFQERYVGTLTDKMLWFRENAIQSILSDLARRERKGLQKHQCDAVYDALNQVQLSFSDLDGLAGWVFSPSSHLQRFRDLYYDWNHLPRMPRERRDRHDDLTRVKNELMSELGQTRSLVLQHVNMNRIVDRSIDHLEELYGNHTDLFPAIGSTVSNYHSRFGSTTEA